VKGREEAEREAQRRPNDAAPGQSLVTDGSGGESLGCEKDDSGQKKEEAPGLRMEERDKDAAAWWYTEAAHGHDEPGVFHEQDNRFIPEGRADDNSVKPSVVEEAIGGEEREAGDTSKPCAEGDTERNPEVSSNAMKSEVAPDLEHDGGEPRYQGGQCHLDWTPPVEECNVAEGFAENEHTGRGDGSKETLPWPRDVREKNDEEGQENPFSAEKSPARRLNTEAPKGRRGEVVVEVIFDKKRRGLETRGAPAQRVPAKPKGCPARANPPRSYAEAQEAKVREQQGRRCPAQNGPAAEGEGRRGILLRLERTASNSHAVVVDLRGYDAVEDQLVFDAGWRSATRARRRAKRSSAPQAERVPTESYEKVDGRELTDDGKLVWTPIEEEGAVEDPTGRSRGTAEGPSNGSAPA